MRKIIVIYMKRKLKEKKKIKRKTKKSSKLKIYKLLHNWGQCGMTIIAGNQENFEKYRHATFRKVSLLFVIDSTVFHVQIYLLQFFLQNIYWCGTKIMVSACNCTTEAHKNSRISKDLRYKLFTCLDFAVTSQIIILSLIVFCFNSIDFSLHRSNLWT